MSDVSNRRTRGGKYKISADASSYIALIRASGSQPVCFFNNKGGVGKTTLVANLAAELAHNYGCRVLVVDADPQCNLTQYVLGNEDFLSTYEADSDQDIESINSVVHPLSIGKGYRKNLPIRTVGNFGFDVIIGDPRLALKEDLLAQDWRDAKAGGTRGLRTTFIFHDLIAKADSYDFIFFDMGPSLGAINRAILLAVNHFVVPMSIDIFSTWAVKNIGSAVKIWQKELDVGLSLAEDPDELPVINNKRLRFAGYVTQQHRERREGDSVRIVAAYEEIRKKLPDLVSSNLSGLFDPLKVTPHLGDIMHLGSLAPKSQSLHTPMTRVNLPGNYVRLRARARESYQAIAERFLKNLSVSAI